MKQFLRIHLRTFAFTAGGMVVGYAWHLYAGCASGSCAIAANPLRTVLYTGIIGFLLSVVFARGWKQCNT